MRYLIGALIGAVIGYITNWLAIKMLFRPYSEKRILGVKVPFTPGLIPKERTRIAKSVGEAIGKHLLTKETIVDSLCSVQISTKLKQWIDKKIRKVYDTKASIKDELEQLSGNNIEIMRNHTQDKIGTLLINTIRQESFKEKANQLIRQKITEVLSKHPNEIIENENFVAIRNNILEGIDGSLNSQELRLKAGEAVVTKLENLENKDTTLGEIVPDTIINTLKVNIDNNKETIAYTLRDALKQDKAEYKIKEIISSMVKNKLNPMVAMFITADSVYEKIMPSVYEMLEKEENHDEIVNIINEVIDNFMTSKLSDVLNKISQKEKTDNIQYITNLVFDKVLNKDMLNNLLINLEGKIQQNDSIDSVAKKANIDLNTIIGDLIVKEFNNYIETQECEDKIREYLNKSIEQVMNIPIQDLIKEDKEKISTIICNLAEDLYMKFIKNKASDFVDALNVAKIVEDKINDFDVEYAEEIIMEIASKELRAITLLGALLGSIMGILSPIINSIF